MFGKPNVFKLLSYEFQVIMFELKVKNLILFLCRSTAQHWLFGSVFLDSHNCFTKWGDKMGAKKNFGNKKHIDEYQNIIPIYWFH